MLDGGRVQSGVFRAAAGNFQEKFTLHSEPRRV
jgi:hypothetical protein